MPTPMPTVKQQSSSRAHTHTHRCFTGAHPWPSMMVGSIAVSLSLSASPAAACDVCSTRAGLDGGGGILALSRCAMEATSALSPAMVAVADGSAIA